MLDSYMVRPFLVPSHLRVPCAKWDPNLYFLNMVAHASTIGVHQGVLAKIRAETLHPDALKASERTCVEAAIEIASIMRTICHVDLSAVSVLINMIAFYFLSKVVSVQVNPFTSFCLYVAATALARTKSIELDEHQKNSLSFLLTAMNYLEVVSPLTRSFKKDLQEEFPDLTAKFSNHSVVSGVRAVVP